MNNLQCPVCGERLSLNGSSFCCAQGHSFDSAKEGYVNLLIGSKPGELIGDNKNMAKSRKAFLDKGYFEPLANGLVALVQQQNPGTVLDICCGEGYYTEKIKSALQAEVYGFDISKEMVRLAAKRKCGAHFFVANMAHIPLAHSSVDVALHLFAPFCQKEFARVLKPGAALISVCPGRNHLFSLKEKLYSTPYENDEIAPEIQGFYLEGVQSIRSSITLETTQDIDALFKMTPYYYRTSDADKEKLIGVETLETQTDFYVRIYRRN